MTVSELKKLITETLFYTHVPTESEYNKAPKAPIHI
jgi:hypothetical protein